MTLPHLDDDQLNAHLDGEDAGAAAAHLAGCRECEARLADLQAAQAAVAVPVPAPPAGDREAAIAAAMDAWGTEPALPHEGDAGSAPVPIRPPRRALPRALVAAAVLVVIGLAAVPFVRMGDDGPSVSTAARDEADLSEAGGTAGVDLGEFDSETALHDRLRTVLGVSGPTPAGGETSGEAFDAPSDMAPLSGSPDGAELTSDRAASAATATKSLGACQPQAAALAGKDHTTLAFSASLVYRGTPGYVFVFIQQDGERLTRRAVVLARSSCSPLVVQSF